MKLFFPHYEDLSTNKKLKDTHFEIVRTMMCEKLIAINNNPNLTKSLIEEHLDLVKKETFFNVSEKNTDCIVITFKFNLFELFNCEFELPIYVYYDEKGQQTHYSAQYNGESRDSTLINYLNLNHFNKEGAELEFYLQKDYYGSSYAIKQKHWVMLLSIRKISNMIYFFDKDHEICRKKFELKHLMKPMTTSYTLNSNGDIASELMLLRFTKHVLNVKAEVDSSFFDPKNIELEDNNWFKVVNKSFYDNFNGDNKVAFIDYLKLIEMMEI